MSNKKANIIICLLISILMVGIGLGISQAMILKSTRNLSFYAYESWAILWQGTHK